MIKSTLIAITASLFVFIISWQFVMIMTRTTCGHSTFDSASQLKQLHYLIEPYKHDNKSLPEVVPFNKIIQEHFQKNSGDQIFKKYNNKNHSLFSIAQYISEHRTLHPWGSPPIYIKDKTLPEGYGFYLTGEDGISKSKGRDPDDLNSWDLSSYHFYPQREHHQKSRRIKLISICPALLTFLYIILRNRK